MEPSLPPLVCRISSSIAYTAGCSGMPYLSFRPSSSLDALPLGWRVDIQIAFEKFVTGVSCRISVILKLNRLDSTVET